MGRSYWYKKWQQNKSFIIENDRLKSKSYVFAPFPKGNLYGFQNADIRGIVAGDVIARYQRLKDKNVLYPLGFHTLGSSSFIECKKYGNSLDDKISDVFYHQMLELGIGINDGKLIDMRHDEYVGNLQYAFLELYERKYISYELEQVYLDKINNKIYDKPSNNLMPHFQKCFTLFIGNLLPQVIKNINDLDCSENIKTELLNYLNPVKRLSLELSLTNGNTLGINMENPEFIGGISFIFINPDHLDITKYTSIDEYTSVMNYLNNNGEMFVYTGVQARNPLTGSLIPIFISTMYDKDVYLGIPSVDEDDRSLALEYGLEIIDIINNGVLKNSDFLDNVYINDAHDMIIDAFVDNEIASVDIIYTKDKINLSSIDGFGPLFPFLMDKANNTLNSLKGYLPYTFSNQFRPVLNANVDVAGEALVGTMNNLFVEGMCPILSILHDELSSLDSIFSEDAKEEYEAWLPIECYIADYDRLIPQVLMPIIIHNILKKEISYTLPDLLHKVIIVDKTLDNVENEIKRSNNNLIDLDEYLDKYYADSIRYYVLSSPLDEEFIFNKYALEDTDNFIRRLESVLNRASDADCKRLDYYFYSFINQCKNHLDNHNTYGYIKKIEAFIEEVLFKEIFSKQQLLLFLRVIFPIFPYLAEEAYERIFNGKYSIINEGWPE